MKRGGYRRWALTLALIGAFAFALVTITGNSSRSLTSALNASAPNPCGVAAKPPARYAHVIWVLLENKSYTDVIGSTAAPYINNLAKKCGLATNYDAVSHPSLPNYIALTSGSTQGITDDNDPSSHELKGSSIFSQLGGNWRSLEESMPSNCDLFDSGDYAVRHNPAAYYTGLRSSCGSRDIPLGGTPNVSARFTLVTPNVCNDMHSCPTSAGDTWLAGFLPKILKSATYAHGGTAIFIIWDEADYSSNYSHSASHVPILVISPTTPVGARSSAMFNHYSLLRTTEEMLGLGCLANACSATSMRSAFRF